MEKKDLFPMSAEHRIAPETLRPVYLGTLADFGLGNPEGIPTSLRSDKEVEEYALLVTRSFVPITDRRHLGCIDGRRVVTQADGSDYVARGRQAGGILSAFITAELGDSMLLQTAQQYTPRQRQQFVEDYFAGQVDGYDISSHSEGCGAALKAAEHVRSAAKPEVARAIQALLAQPDISDILSAQFNSREMSKVTDNAHRLAEVLSDTEWSGEDFCRDAKAKNPTGFEHLEGDPTHRFHGHNEPIIGIVASPDEITADKQWFDARGIENPFLVTLQDTRRIARLLPSVQSGQVPTIDQAVMANLAFHLGVSDNLPHPDMPVVLFR